MTVITSKEFASNQKKYFDMAVNEEVCIKRGTNRYQLMYNPVERTKIPEQPILEPDDDLRRAITMDELRDKVLVFIDKLYANK